MQDQSQRKLPVSLRPKTGKDAGSCFIRITEIRESQILQEALDQGFQADQNQHKAANALRNGAVLIAKHGTNLYADGGQGTGGAADQQGSNHNVGFHCCKANANGKGVKGQRC